MDGATEVCSINEKIVYTKGQSLAECRTPTGKMIQKAVDAFEVERKLDENIAVDAAVTTLKNNITTTL